MERRTTAQVYMNKVRFLCLYTSLYAWKLGTRRGPPGVGVGPADEELVQRAPLSDALAHCGRVRIPEHFDE